ncbi:MAG TPA: cytochrome c [Steroidobacteraceae bacterium]|nr:cytochrome c [Steroidobacteraceae bacterium]
MKRIVLIVAVLIVVGLIAVAILNRSDPAAGTAPAIAGATVDAAVAARGEYLTRAADCIACHTLPGSGKPFAGGVAFKLPFGTIYSSNITPDPKYGIGAYSDDEFVRAVREGVRRDGAHLYPAFPYTSYTALARSDVLAIRAYLATLPAISEPNRPNELSFPFNQRWAMSFWNAAFFKSQRFKADPSKSAQWNSGAYLATALGHCGECHTPRNFGFGLEHAHELAGEELQGWRAYNITSDAKHGIGSWSDTEIAAYLTTGHSPGRAAAAGPMGEAVAHSLQFMKPDDSAALVSYLRTVPAQGGKHPIDIDVKPPALAASTAVLPAAQELHAGSQGLKLFEGACVGCHEWTGQGRQTNYATLDGTRGVNDVSAANVTEIILQGVHMRVGGNDVYMPAFGKAYSDVEVSALANYVVAHFGGKQGTVTPADVAKRRLL